MENRSLLDHHGLLQTIFERNPAAILVLGKGSLIRLVNREAESVTSFQREELEEKKKWTDLFLAEDHEKVRNQIRMFKAGNQEIQDRLECRMADKHGRLKTLQISGFFHPELELNVLTLIDITHLKEHEAKLQTEREKAETSDRLKSTFLGNLSHEIRTPMNAIVGFASLLRDQEHVDEKNKMYLSQIITGSSDLMQLVDKTIILSRIDLGQIKVNPRQYFVNKSLGEMAEKYRSRLERAGKKDIELVFEPGRKEMDFVIQADPIRINDILNNLLENAVKFTREGRITLGYAYLEEETESGEDALLFYVKDTGIGISPEKTGIVFDRFVKLVDQNENVFRGAGLGLAIARDLVRLLGGDIWLESTPGRGTSFFFTLPINYSKTHQARPPESHTGKEYTDWSAHSILVAEDMESNYLYIKELINPTGMKILRARDGLEAVELFRTHPEIDLVLMDILMPGLDGYEATVKIREIRPGIPVIAQTAFTFEGEIRDGLYAGCFNDYIMKPFTRDMLVASMKKHISSSK